MDDASVAQSGVHLRDHGRVAALRADLPDRAQRELVDPARIGPAGFKTVDQPGDQFVWLQRGEAAIGPRLAARGADRIADKYTHACLQAAGG